MQPTQRFSNRYLAAALVLFAVCSLSRISVRADDAARVIPIVAKRFAFTPNQITLKKGEKVILRLTTEDVTHGFYLKPLKIDETIEPGKATDVTLIPEVTGSFTTICDHFCGVNHGGMKMTIVVE